GWGLRPAEGGVAGGEGVVEGGGGRFEMNLPRRNFLYLAAGAAALPAVSRSARAQAYPARPVRIIRSGRFRRHRRASDGSMVVGAARPAICFRETDRGRRPKPDPGGRGGNPGAARTAH